MNPLYPELLQHVHGTGMKVSPRGMETSEIIGGHVSLRAGEMVGRKGYNPLLGVAELLMVLQGTFDVEVIRAVAPKAKMSLFTYQAAYGPRTVDQMTPLVDELKRDPLTRRAVLYLTTPGEPLDQSPCTTTIHFLRRAGIMNAVVSMRSWDAIYGLPYDIVMFGGLVQAVARAVHPGLQAGYVLVHAGSLHVYKDTASLGEGAGDYGEFAMNLPAEPADWTSIQRWAGVQLDYLVDKRELPPGFVVELSRGETSG